MELEGLGDLELNLILSRLDAKDVAVLACVNNKFRDSASEESLWFKFCSEDFNLFVLEDPSGNPTSSFKVTYQIWRQAFGMYPCPLVKRVKAFWDNLKSWMTVNFPEARSTLQKGASEIELKEVEESLGVKLPLPTRVLYRFCNGQETKNIDSSGSEFGSLLGLIGGYFFYDHHVNVYLLPLSQVVEETKEFVRNLGFATRSKFIVVASSFTRSNKLFFLNCITGQLSVGTRNLFADGEMIPCVPPSLIRSIHSLNAGQPVDALLLWLEEHGRRLQSGIIQLRGEGNVRSINLFPELAPLCTTAITNGVQIRASSVFVPEQSNLQVESEKYCFSYSIRMCLVPEGCVVNGTSFSSCQLHSRHWIIRSNDIVVNDTGGPGVIGEYPYLYPGGREFVYESCTPLASSPGSIEGHFTFVPGRLTYPKGQPFDVEVARFPLQLPDYIF